MFAAANCVLPEKPSDGESLVGRDQTYKIEIGGIYRLRHGSYMSYDHLYDYDNGNFIHVKVLSGPNKYGLYDCTTRGEDGEHMGPGGGWHREYEEKGGVRFSASELEPHL